MGCDDNVPCLTSTRKYCFHRFVNMGFTVMTGANLVFDMPETNFGPNTEVSTQFFACHCCRLAS